MGSRPPLLSDARHAYYDVIPPGSVAFQPAISGLVQPGLSSATLGGMVNLTRIYTRTGDAGQTRLGDMSVTSKNDLRLEAYAGVDEANAVIGVAVAQGGLEEDVITVLTRIQNDLFDVGADFCTPIVENPAGRGEQSRGRG